MKGCWNCRREPSSIPCIVRFVELPSTSIQNDLRTVPKHFPPGIPRIYDVFDSSTNEMMTFDTSKLFQNATVFSKSSQHHFFTSTPCGDDGPSASTPVLLKMVAGSYGKNVHQSLAGVGYAPRLYGWFKEKDLPTVYVMEMLSEDWVTLWDFRLQPNCADYRQQISDAISVILEHLKEHNLVHGDLRANNVMLNVKDGKPVVGIDGTVLLKVIDFDWSGDAGKVFYPMQRNPNIEWPAPEGSEILVEHDRQVVDSWLTVYQCLSD